MEHKYYITKKDLTPLYVLSLAKTITENHNYKPSQKKSLLIKLSSLEKNKLCCMFVQLFKNYIIIT